VLYNLAREFLSDSQIGSITSYQGHLFGAHHNEYSAFTSRIWTSDSCWSDVDEITKLRYLGHNCGILLTRYNYTPGRASVETLLASYGISPTPEPSSLVLLGSGLGLSLLWISRRRLMQR
jgi:hypothetical protein